MMPLNSKFFRLTALSSLFLWLRFSSSLCRGPFGWEDMLISSESFLLSFSQVSTSTKSCGTSSGFFNSRYHCPYYCLFDIPQPHQHSHLCDQLNFQDVADSWLICFWSCNQASCNWRALKQCPFVTPCGTGALSLLLCVESSDGPGSKSAVDSRASIVFASSVTTASGWDRLSLSSTGHPSAIWKAWQVLLWSLPAFALCSGCWNSTRETT